ncbi:hypothetical protein CXX84_07260 [Arthrobacter sp. AFG7.2]|nr:hypothetical protein CXX84_07260 [Arthrobacter sp. AFG7.2]
MRAAEKGVSLSLLEVDVDSESADRGLLGIVKDTPAGPLALRTVVRIAAHDTEKSILRDIVEWADEHSPVDDAVRRAVPVELTVVVG